jgi:hypothetical protein
VSLDIDDRSRNRAISVLLVTLFLGVASWLLIGKATKAGISRLEAIDRARAQCDSLYATARGRGDSANVDAQALRDTVDARSSNAMKTCGDLSRQ